MRKSISGIDRKRAASGERDDEAQMVLGAIESLPELAKPIKTKRTTSRIQKPLQTVLMSPPSYIPPPEIRVLDEAYCSANINVVPAAFDGFFKSRHLNPVREIVAEFGRTQPGDRGSMSIGHITQLSSDKLERKLNVKHDAGDGLVTLDRLTGSIYKLTIDRNDLSDENEEKFTGLTLDVHFSSRIQFDFIDSSSDLQLAPIGKAKIFFPKQYSKAVVYLDMSKYL